MDEANTSTEATNESVDTSAEQVDTTNEDTSNTESDSILKGLDFAEETGEDSTESGKDDQASESKQDKDTEESESETDTQEEQSEDTQTTDPKEQARLAYQQREEARRERQNDRQELEQSQQDYIEDGQDEADQITRQLQVEAYNSRVERNESRLTTSFEKAMQHEVFQNMSPAVQARLGRAVDAFEARYVEIDKLGNPTNVAGDLYQYLQEEANAILAERQECARQEKANTAKTRSNAFTPPSRSPRPSKEDPIMKGLTFDD